MDEQERVAADRMTYAAEAAVTMARIVSYMPEATKAQRDAIEAYLRAEAVYLRALDEWVKFFPPVEVRE